MVEEIELTLTYKFKITQKDFEGYKEHWAKFAEDNAKFDPVNMFYAMRLIKNPDEDKAEIKVIK